jgi:hypothetical protein
MNPANGLQNGFIANSQGNAFPMFGTGKVLYAQLGYLMNQHLLGEGNGTLMPYISLMSAEYDKLADRMNLYDVGVNWLLKGHTSKVTLNYQSRPVYEQQGNELKKTDRKAQVVLQYQIFF